jgi:PAS domain S-box-containing protein
MEHDRQEGLAQALFEECGDALFLFEPADGRLVDVNRAGQRLSGFPLRELLGRSVTALFRHDGPGGPQHLLEAASQPGVFQAAHGFHLCTVQEGVWIPVHLSAARLHVKPQPLGLLTARDGREQHEAQCRLAKAEGELRRVLAAVSECLWQGEVDAAGRCAFHAFSPAVEQLTGKAAEYFLEGVHRWWAIVHPEDQPRWARALVRLRGGQPSREEYRLVRPDGTVCWVRERVRVSPAHDSGGRRRLDGVLTDITEHRRAEGMWRQSEERFRAFLDNSPALAFLKDQAGRHVDLNQSFHHLFRMARGDSLGKADIEK